MSNTERRIPHVRGIDPHDWIDPERMARDGFSLTSRADRAAMSADRRANRRRVRQSIRAGDWESVTRHTRLNPRFLPSY